MGRWPPNPPLRRSAPPRPPAAPARRLLPLVLPAIAVGVVCALVLLGVSLLAEQFQDVLWKTLPDTLGVGRFSSLWMVVMLTATGLAVGLVLRTVPGHGGPDPATTGLVDAPMRPGIVPGLLLVTVLALAGGVSLGPENPITAANIALTFWLGRSGSRPVRRASCGWRWRRPERSGLSSAPRSPPR